MKGKSFSDLFDDLLQEQPDAKLKAADKILSILTSGKPIKTLPKTSTKSQEFGTNISDGLQYSLKRLISGTTSMVVDWQMSFGFPLIHFLKTFDEIDVESFINHVFSVCDPKKTVKKSELSHFLFGKQLCLIALLDSKRLAQHSAKRQIFEKLCNDTVETIVNQTWAREGSIKLLIKLIDTLADKGKLSPANIINHLTPHLKPLLKASVKPDASLLQLVVGLERFCRTHKIENPWSFHLENFLTNRAELFQTIFVELAENFPQRHTVIKDLIVHMSNYKKGDAWTKFWQGVNDFVEQDSLNFKVFHLVLYGVKVAIKQGNGKMKSLSELTTVLQPNIINIWLRNLKSMNKVLKTMSFKIEKVLSAVIEGIVKQGNLQHHSADALELLTLLKGQTFYAFPPKSSLCRTLVKSMNGEDQTQFVTFLKDRLPGHPSPQAYKYCVNELAAAIIQNYEALDEEIILDACNVLMKQSIDPDLDFESFGQKLAEDKKEVLMDVTAEELTPEKVKKQLQEFCFGKLQSVITMLNKRPLATQKGKKSELLRGICSDQVPFVEKILRQWVALTKSQADFASYREVLRKVLKKSKEITGLIAAKKDQTEETGLTTKKLVAFQSFMLNLCFHHQKYENENVEALEELFPLFDDLVNHYTTKEEKASEKKKKVKKSSKNVAEETQEENEEPKFIKVMVELMVSLLTRTENFLRETIIQLFEQFCDEIRGETFDILTAVIIRPEEEFVNEQRREAAGGEDGDESEEEVEINGGGEDNVDAE